MEVVVTAGDLTGMFSVCVCVCVCIQQIRVVPMELLKGNSFFLLFISAYNTWVISPPCPHPLPYPSYPLPLPSIPSIPGRNYFALISNFVEERV
jgi:hypothetical protein